jgi:TonB-dependent receptor
MFFKDSIQNDEKLFHIRSIIKIRILKMIFQNESRHLKALLNFQAFVFIVAFFLITPLANAQSGGNLKGKVYDKISGDPLPSANVYLEGSLIGTASDIEGNYLIKNIPAGNHNIVFSYVGYSKKIIKVLILSNKTDTLNVPLNWNSDSTIKEVVVTGQLEGQSQAINQQVNSDQIVNVVSEQKIQELPDANAAESIGRLPGVAVQREGGEADKLMVRGLDPRFTTVTLNGIQVPGTDFDDRSIDLSLISQSSLSGIELYKALTPDQDADAIAGTVNLITGQARPGQKITVSLYGIYGGITQNPKQYRAALQYSDRFVEDRLGVQAEVNGEDRDRTGYQWNQSWNIPANNSQYQINSLVPQLNNETRIRYNAYLNLDYNTNDGGNIKFLNSYDRTTRDIFTSSRDYNTGAMYVTYIGEAQDIYITTFNNSLVGENYLGLFKINWALSQAFTLTQKPFDHWMRFYENETTTSGMKIITNPNILQEPGVNLIPYAWNNFEVADMDRCYFYQEESSERNYEAKADVEYPLNFNNLFDGLIKFGYKLRDKVRHRNGDESMTAYWLKDSYSDELENGQIVPKDWADSDWPNGYTGRLTDYMQGPPYKTLNIDNKYLLNPVLSEQLVRDWYSFNKNGISPDGTTPEYIPQLTALNDFYNVNENINSAYLMTKINYTKLISLIAGVRFEYENNFYNAYYVPYIIGEFNQTTPVKIDTTTQFKQFNWFPNIHVKVQPCEWWNIMLAATKTIARPDFSMRLPSLTVDSPDQQIYATNPNLQPAISWNFDASTSLYTSQFGLFTIDGFRKNISNMFYWLDGITLMNAQQARNMGLPVDKYGPWNQYLVNMPYNTPNTKVWGFELDLQTHLSFLPGVLQNIVINANYTRTWSNTEYPRFTLVQSTGFPPKPPTPLYYYTQDPLTGQTDYIENFSVGYDYKGFSGRLSAYFQGPYLNSINNLQYLDVYQKAFSRWDLSLKQNINDNYQIYVNVNNLSNTIEGSYDVYRNLDMGGYYYGLSLELGMRYTFD